MDTMSDPTAEPEAEPRAADQALVRQIQKRIKADKKYHEAAFKRMRRNMFLATNGRSEDWDETRYRANLIGRHVKQKTAALYAKNPKATAKRRETLDFALWDENPQSLLAAVQLAAVQLDQQAQMMQAAAPVTVDPMTGQPTQQPVQIPGLMEAQALIADVQQGMARRQQITKIGKTLEILFSHAMAEQKPLEFKAAAKRAVGRTAVTGVSYVELGFQRETGPRPGVQEQLADARARLDHLRKIATDVAEGEVDADAAEIAELEAATAALMAEPEIVMREGLIFDWPQSTRVIPDKQTRGLTGFVGARHLTIEYVFSVDEVKEMFPVFDEKGKWTQYHGETGDEDKSANWVQEDEERTTSGDVQKTGMVCVWKHYDKPSGLVYYLADGCDYFLRPPAAPEVFVEDFWPVYAFTTNETENENQLFPPSDVELLEQMQAEYNRAREGQREHRKAARPRWATSAGMLDDVDAANLTQAKPFEVIPMKALQPGQKVTDVLQPVPVPGVDPNLYETNMLFTDTQLVVGAQESSFGGVAKATATESAIAANSTQSSDQASIDELDAWLTRIARASSQILLREMSEEQVKKIVGVGALWPQMTLAEIAGEIYLEVEAGSTGKPNQAVEINNMERLLPYLVQMPGINPLWLAKEVLRRMDDRLDLTEALVEGLPSIVTMNRSAQPGTGDPASDPAAQGPEGGDNAQTPPEQAGTNAAFGSNQV